jgi:hypothetical protein
LKEELAFDTFLDAPPWKKVETAFLALRQEEGKGLEAENLEFAYLRSQEWMKRNLPRAARLGPKSTRRGKKRAAKPSRARG